MRIPLTVALLVAMGSSAWAMDVDPGYRLKRRLENLAMATLSKDAAEAKAAVEQLRIAGPEGLDAMFTLHWAAIQRHRQNPLAHEPVWGALSTALDAVAGQRDAWAAQLYWYTDLNEAVSAAKRQNKPILSLRLLGTLDSEFSCANSRYFRTVLYANTEVSRFLRENFVLHWKSHRPVPKLTIDFGDGRTIERTITGNSVHYVLTPEGRVVDVIPGLYGAGAFMAQAQSARGAALQYKEAGFDTRLVQYHREMLEWSRQQWTTDLARVGAEVPPVKVNGELRRFDARAAGRIAISKSAVEMRPVLALLPERGALATATDDAAWAKIAALRADESKLDAGSRALMMSKVEAANDTTFSKRRVESPFVRILRNFERSVAEDTVRNEYVLHGQVHQWFIDGQAPQAFDDLNEKVYAELFLMPKDDPFLGLVPEDTYTGLPEAAAR